jgi:hypothetical protein
MTSERAEAYGRLMRRLRALGAAGLLPHEEEQIREAADALLFCSGDWSDEATLEALGEAFRLIEGLVQVGRWREAPAQLLLRELRACGPLAAV